MASKRRAPFLSILGGSIAWPAMLVLVVSLSCDDPSPGDIPYKHPTRIRQDLPLYTKVTDPPALLPYLGPRIFVSKTILPDFGYVPPGIGSPYQSYLVEGQKLVGDLTINPPPGFEITVGSSSGNSLSPGAEGRVPPTTVSVRFKPTAVQPYGGSIDNSSPGAATRQVSVQGHTCAKYYFEAIGDLEGDCCLSFVSDISADGSRVAVYSAAYDMTVPTSGGSECMGGTYPHAWQAAGWTRSCTNLQFSAGSSAAGGLVGLGYLSGAKHSESSANGISPDGQYVVGHATFDPEDPLPTKATYFHNGLVGTLQFPTGYEKAVARDISNIAHSWYVPTGSGNWFHKYIAVGFAYTGDQWPDREAGAQAVCWGDLLSGLPFFKPYILTHPDTLENGAAVISSEAVCVSDDGKYIVGNLYYLQDGGTQIMSLPCLWKHGAPPTFLGALSDLAGGAMDARAIGFSGDGTTIVGWGKPATDKYTACVWRVDLSAGTVNPPTPLPFLGPSTISSAAGISADGSTIVGLCIDPVAGAVDAVLWDGENTTTAPVTVASILENNAIEIPQGWFMTSAECVSHLPDGTIVVAGYAERPDLCSGNPDAVGEEGWVAAIPNPF